MLVIQTEHLDAACAAWLGERCELVRCPSDEEPRFGELLARADGLVIRTYTMVNPDLLARAPRLKVVGRAGVGLDNVDVSACRERAVQVVSTPAANTRAVVEFVTSLILDALRPRLSLAKALDPKAWRSLREDLIAPRQLSDLTLGILGLGQIGSQVARVGAALNMRVLYHDVAEIPGSRRSGAEPVTQGALLENADVLTIHVDGRLENRGLLGAAHFARLKKDVVLINTSRGFVLDNMALADFLIGNPGALALLDVHEPEPFDHTYPLLDIKNVRLSPHIAAATRSAHRNMSWVVRDVARVLAGEAPQYPAWK